MPGFGMSESRGSSGKPAKSRQARAAGSLYLVWCLFELNPAGYGILDGAG
jgi:hypothetical protein